MRKAPFSLITVDDREAATQVIRRLGLMDSDESIESMERAGEGNMNVVLRIRTPQRSLILKQSRPWVEKYPQIDAPADRILAEIGFYRRIQKDERIRRSVPNLLGFDADAHVLVLEDLGEASDFTDLYGKHDPESMPLQEVTSWLASLHAIEIEPAQRGSIENRALRALNHAHIFVIPLQSPSAIALDQVCGGLEDLANRVRASAKLSATAQRLGDRYLQVGDSLLHGDYYPGSWLRTESGVRIIDPEFTFAGPPEFDLGVLAAHRVMIGGEADSAQTVASLYEQFGGQPVDASLLQGFAAMEIIRRLIGVAQLPLSANLEQRSKMISIAMDWVA